VPIVKVVESCSRAVDLAFSFHHHLLPSETVPSAVGCTSPPQRGCVEPAQPLPALEVLSPVLGLEKTPGELKRVLQFIDQTESKAGQVLMNNGIQGKNFQVDTKDAQYASPINQKSATYRQIVTDTTAISQLKTGVNEKNQPYRVVPQPLQGLADRRYQIMSRDEQHAIYNEAAPYVSKTYSKNGAVLDNIIMTAEIQYMAGEIDDQGWQQAIDKWLKAGGQQVIKEYSTLNRQKN